ncbi:Glycosyltransferase family 2 [Neofusicoccum parvum]|nr:Glycosyltransferase family 2 [Neofusicoccum parvum]
MLAYRDDAMYTPPPLPRWRLILNSILGLAFWILTFFLRQKTSSFLPLTLDTLGQILLTDITRQKSARALAQLQRKTAHADAEHSAAAGRGNAAGVPYLVSIVGYREEEALFRRCLQSYRTTCTGAATLLVGIDGDEPEDLEMVAAVRSVYPQAVVLGLPEPLGEMAQRLAELKAFGGHFVPSESAHERLEVFHALPEELKRDAEEWAMEEVVKAAGEMLSEGGVLREGEGDGMQVVCFHEPHRCKKDIIFTNLVLSMAMGRARGVDYVWTSDSDTLVLENTVDQAIGCMALDPGIGGTCTSLGVHNGHQSGIAALTAAAYWSELAFCRGQTGSVEATDCQPGPCAAFKISALEKILFPWYMQTSLGRKTIVNDDRHLSTCLMLANYRITFNTYVLTLTDTPTTSMALLLQQLRWSRATYIETLQYPLVYAIRGPVALICAVRRVYGPLAMAVFTARYAWSGSVPFAFSPLDFALRLALCAGYNLLFFRRHLRGAVRHWSLLVASQLFYQVPLPGIAVWSCVTMLQGSWGTSMRGVGEKRRARHPGWENLGAVLALSAWLGVVGAAVGRWVAATWFHGMEGVCARAAWMAVAVWMSWFFLRKQKA